MQLGYIKKRSLENEYDDASWQDKFIAFKPCLTPIGKKKLRRELSEEGPFKGSGKKYVN
jgi:hypothetical protein